MRIADCRLRNETFSRYDYCIQFVASSFMGAIIKNPSAIPACRPRSRPRAGQAGSNPSVLSQECLYAVCHSGLDKPAPYSIRGNPAFSIWIPAFSEILKWQIILHLKPMLSNKRVKVLCTFDIMNPFFESFSKIKYGGLYMTSVFDKAQYGYF